MNRIQLLAPEPVESVIPPTSVDVNLSRADTGVVHQPATFFIPLSYERNYAYPLLVWLHGEGGDERHLQRVMPLISMRNYVAVAPRGVCAVNHRGYGWGVEDELLLAAEHRIQDCIDAACRKFRVAERRVFLAGFGTGGTMAFQIALRRPERFGGVLSIGGPFPLDRTPLMQLDAARSLPLFIAQGRDAQGYPIERTCQELRLFHAAGMNVTLRQYPCGDELDSLMLRDMDVWMMDQIAGVSNCTAEVDAERWN